MPRTTKPIQRLQETGQEPDSKAFIRNLYRKSLKVDPIEEQDCLFGEYQTILEQENILEVRKEEIRQDFKQRLLALSEEVEKSSDCYIESSDGLMKFSIVQSKQYKFSVMTEGLIEAHKRATDDLKDLKNKEIRHGEAKHSSTRTSVRFAGPKIK
jgi:hypothetical protein